MDRHSRSARADAADCTTCHQTAFCQSCHGAEMPHPDGWLLAHKDEAAFSPDAVCFRCHQYEEKCAQCHGAAVPEQ
jgi:hypothetical protein